RSPRGPRHRPRRPRPRRGPPRRRPSPRRASRSTGSSSSASARRRVSAASRSRWPGSSSSSIRSSTGSSRPRCASCSAPRSSSPVFAALGRSAGFLAPRLLSTGTDRPIGVFGYVLLLDTGLLYLARRRRWPVLALLSLAGTVFYQALWIGTRMGPDRLLLGLAILGAFALLFAVAPRLAGGEETDLEWLIAQAGGVLVPLAFVLYFASRT